MFTPPGGPIQTDLLGTDADLIAQNALKKLSPGLYVQPYMDSFKNEADFIDFMNEAKDIGFAGVAIQGSSKRLTAVSGPGKKVYYEGKAKIVSDRGMKPLAAFGMDSDDMTGKAKRIGSIYVRPDCNGVLLDGEGKLEDESADLEFAHMKEFYDAFVPFRRARMDCLLVDQPWPDVRYHWSKFPYEWFAALVDAHCPQYYDNDFVGEYGSKRHEKCVVRFNGAWNTLFKRLAPQGLKRAKWQTIQGYGFSDIPNGLRDYLAGSKAHPLFVWYERNRHDAATLKIIRDFIHGQ